MKKIFTLFMAVVLAIGSTVAQSVILEYDFNDKDKTGLGIYDEDNLTPGATMQSVGFAAGTTWILLRDSGSSTNYFLGSTSQYLPAGQANDWLVLPAINVASDKYTLEWKSQAYLRDLRDGLKVFISTEGGKPANFPAEPVWAVEAEEAGATDDFEGEFITHQISLAQYAGQTIHIAFVNQSYDKCILAIDDIKVYSNDKFGVELNLGNVLNEVDEVEFAGNIVNYQLDNLNEVVVELSYDDVKVSETFANLNLAKGQSAAFAMKHTMPIKLNETKKYTLQATVGEETFTIASSVTNSFRRRVVIEDHTGIRCQYCPAGTWAIDSLKEVAPDQIAPIAVQCSQYGSVNLLVEDYTIGLVSNGLTAYPTGWVDRTYVASPFGNASGYNFDDPASWISRFYQILNEAPQAGVTASATLSSDASQIHAKASVRLAESKENIDWRVIFVLTEDGVEGYYQSNSYSGHKGWVGGWESKPRSASVVLNDLARGIYPSFYGEEGSLPSSINVGEVVEYSYDITIPYKKTLASGEVDFVLNVNNLNVIAMLVDGKTNQVINADLVSLANSDAVEGVENDNMKVSAFAENGTVKVTTNHHSEITASLIAIDGCMLATATGNGAVTLSATGYRGVALVHTVANGISQVEKVVIR